MTLIGNLPEPDPSRAAIQAATLADETTCIEALVAEADPGVAARRLITAKATILVERIRDREQSAGGLDAFLHQYDLSRQEGGMLMCLAEALLRVPDPDTADKLIADMIGAVVGVQQFGGEGLSGTGSKASGPRYLHRFATERTLSVNTAAAGGNTALLSLEEDDGF